MGESLEWLTSASEFIGIYRIMSAEARSTTIYWVDIGGNLETALKGDCPDTIAILNRPTQRVPFRAERVLVFNNKTWYAPYFINLDHAETKYFNCAITAKSEVLVDEGLILSVVKGRLSYLEEKGATPEHYENAILEGVPYDSPVFWALWEMKAVFLAIPADEESRYQYIDWAMESDGFTKVNAVCTLMYCYPEYPIVPLLKDMLTDKGIGTRWSGTESEFYPAREFAYETLKDMGIDVDVPEGYDNSWGEHSGMYCVTSHWNRHPR